jgi:hypothetical protein
MRDIQMKVSNMAKPQSFTLYPYSGGERFAKVNLRTGKGFINGSNKNYANSIHLQINPVSFQLPEDIQTKIQGYLWHNEGKEGNINGIVFFENKELFITN